MKKHSILIVILSVIAGYLGNNLLIRFSLIQPTKEHVFHVYLDSAKFQRKEVPADSLTNRIGNPITTVTLDKSQILFHENPYLLIWATIMLILMSIEYGSLPVFIWQIKKLCREFALTNTHLRRAVAYSLIVLGFFIVASLLFKGYTMESEMMDKFDVLLNNGCVLTFINAQVFVLQAPAVMLIFLAATASETIKCTFDRNNDDGKKEEIDKAVMQFKDLHQLLSASLMFLAVTVIFSVLTTSALRQSMLTALAVHGFNLIPAEISYVYALSLSLSIGVVYLPSYYYLKLKSAELHKTILQMNSVKDPGIDDEWKQTTLAALEINTTPMQNLKVLLAVVSPLITSVVTQLHLFK